MRGFKRTSGLFVLVICALLMAPGTCLAADLYLSGALSISAGTGSVGGSGNFGGAAGDFENTGSDSDSSPVLGGSIGYNVPLNELVPYAWDWPLPRWALRMEFEGVGLRNYEILSALRDVTSGSTVQNAYLTEVSSWGILHNWWLDLPVHAPLSWAFGRIPILEPMTLELGGGVGMGMTELDTTGVAFDGSDETIHLTWQVGTGLDYELTDRVSVGVGYRYVDLGTLEHRLFNGNTPVGNLTMDLASHELRTGLRVNFYSVPSPGSWKRPRFRRGR